jgi:hypothetical protein
LLAWNRLCDPVDVVIEEDRGNGISARDWMIGEEYDGLTAGRDLNGAAYHALARQFLLGSGVVSLQRLTGQPDPDSIAVA